MKLIRILLALLVLAIGLMFQQLSYAQQLEVPNSVLGNGGDVMEDGSYRIIGTVGQPAIGVAGSSSNIVHAGFWHLPAPIVAGDVILRTVDYRFGDPSPGFNMDNFPIYRYWMNVKVENTGDGNAFNVAASISSWPPNASLPIPDVDVTVGDIPAGNSAWSSDTYTIELDLMQPGGGADQGITWTIEYDDNGGGHHVIEDVPEFPPAAPSINRRAQWFVVIPQPKLYQCYPNPFNPDTWIPYQLSKDTEVVIRIYNLSGQLIKKIELGSKPRGFYIEKDKAAYWNGCNEAGETVSSGLYFYQIQAGDFQAVRKMVILK